MLHPGLGRVVRWTYAFNVRGGADRPGWGQIRRRTSATLERDASVERSETLYHKQLLKHATRGGCMLARFMI